MTFKTCKEIIDSLPELDNFDKRIGGILVEDFDFCWEEALKLLEKFGHTEFFIELGSLDNNEVKEEIPLGLDDLIRSVDPDHFYPDIGRG